MRETGEARSAVNAQWPVAHDASNGAVNGARPGLRASGRGLALGATLALAAGLILAPAAFGGPAHHKAHGATLMTHAPDLVPGSITKAEWAAYSDAFLARNGRIVDTANDAISHSEGQGYGLTLALLADEPGAFARIWTFTRTEMMIRDDGLAAWRFAPAVNADAVDAEDDRAEDARAEDAAEDAGESADASAETGLDTGLDTGHGRITDANNASDGDLLIANALIAAGQAWNRDELQAEGIALAEALAAHSIITHDGRTLLMPAAHGFSADDQADGPIVNLSYLVFEAFPRLFAATGDPVWTRVAEDGLALLSQARFSERRLPPDWLALAGKTPALAKGFAPTFGYNAIRIPLYLTRAGLGSHAVKTTGSTADDAAAPAEDDDGQADRVHALLSEIAAASTDVAGNLVLYDLDADSPVETLSEPGYRMVAAATACALAGTAIPGDLKTFAPTLYYPSTLHLLALAHVRQEHPQCL